MQTLAHITMAFICVYQANQAQKQGPSEEVKIEKEMATSIDINNN